VLQADGSYGSLDFAGYNVSPTGSTTFSPELLGDGTQMIVTRAGISEEEEAELGQRGFYLHHQTDSGWDDGTLLPLPYGWDATLLPDDQLFYVNGGDLYVISL